MRVEMTSAKNTGSQDKYRFDKGEFNPLQSKNEIKDKHQTDNKVDVSFLQEDLENFKNYVESRFVKVDSQIKTKNERFDNFHIISNGSFELKCNSTILKRSQNNLVEITNYEKDADSASTDIGSDDNELELELKVRNPDQIGENNRADFEMDESEGEGDSEKYENSYFKSNEENTEPQCGTIFNKTKSQESNQRIKRHEESNRPIEFVDDENKPMKNIKAGMSSGTQLNTQQEPASVVEPLPTHDERYQHTAPHGVATTTTTTTTTKTTTIDDSAMLELKMQKPLVRKRMGTGGGSVHMKLENNDTRSRGQVGQYSVVLEVDQLIQNGPCNAEEQQKEHEYKTRRSKNKGKERSGIKRRTKNENMSKSGGEDERMMSDSKNMDGKVYEEKFNNFYEAINSFRECIRSEMERMRVQLKHMNEGQVESMKMHQTSIQMLERISNKDIHQERSGDEKEHQEGSGHNKQHQEENRSIKKHQEEDGNIKQHQEQDGNIEQHQKDGNIKEYQEDRNMEQHQEDRNIEQHQEEDEITKQYQEGDADVKQHQRVGEEVNQHQEDESLKQQDGSDMKEKCEDVKNMEHEPTVIESEEEHYSAVQTELYPACGAKLDPLNEDEKIEVEINDEKEESIEREEKGLDVEDEVQLESDNSSVNVDINNNYGGERYQQTASEEECELPAPHATDVFEESETQEEEKDKTVLDNLDYLHHQQQQQQQQHQQQQQQQQQHTEFENILHETDDGVHVISKTSRDSPYMACDQTVSVMESIPTPTERVSPCCSSQYEVDDDVINRNDSVMSRNSNFVNVSTEYGNGGRMTSSTTSRRGKKYSSERILESKLSANQDLVDSLRERISSLEAKHKEKQDVIKFLMKQMSNPDFVMQLSCTKSK